MAKTASLFDTLTAVDVKRGNQTARSTDVVSNFITGIRSQITYAEQVKAGGKPVVAGSATAPRTHFFEKGGEWYVDCKYGNVKVKPTAFKTLTIDGVINILNIFINAAETEEPFKSEIKAAVAADAAKKMAGRAAAEAKRAAEKAAEAAPAA